MKAFAHSMQPEDDTVKRVVAMTGVGHCDRIANPMRLRVVVGLLILFVFLLALTGCGESTKTKLPDLNEDVVTGYWVGPWLLKPDTNEPLPYLTSELTHFYEAYARAETYHWPDQEFDSLLAVVLSRDDESAVIVWVSPDLPLGCGLVRFFSDARSEDYRFHGEELVEAVVRLADGRLSPIEKTVIDPNHKWFPETSE